MFLEKEWGIMAQLRHGKTPGGSKQTPEQYSTDSRPESAPAPSESSSKPAQTFRTLLVKSVDSFLEDLVGTEVSTLTEEKSSRYCSGLWWRRRPVRTGHHERAHQE